MKKIQKIGLIFLLILSVTLNFVFYFRLTDLNDKLGNTNKLIAANVETNIRQSMRYSKELKDTNAPDSLKNLQRTVQELTVTFKHWVDLNQADSFPNQQMAMSLSGIEALRNTLIHHLDIQYQSNNKTLQDFDIELLDKAYENLDRLLMIYLNLEGSVTKLRHANKDYGLAQVANNIEEITRLYRHSSLPNKHPDYITYEEAVNISSQLFPDLSGLELQTDKTAPSLKDGIHYYELKYLKDKELISVVWIDAINGGLRNYELKAAFNTRQYIQRDDAFFKAKESLRSLYGAEVISEFYKIAPAEEKKNSVYSFRFIPTINSIPFTTDAITINIDEATGEIIKISNDSNIIQMPEYSIAVTPKEIEAVNYDVLGEMEYKGLAVVRSFQTRYKPTVSHSFITKQNNQEMLIYFDVASGVKIHQLVNVYEPIEGL